MQLHLPVKQTLLETVFTYEVMNYGYVMQPVIVLRNITCFNATKTHARDTQFTNIIGMSNIPRIVKCGLITGTSLINDGSKLH